MNSLFHGSEYNDQNNLTSSHVELRGPAQEESDAPLKALRLLVPGSSVMVSAGGSARGVLTELCQCA
jgi:hypothetical protein